MRIDVAVESDYDFIVARDRHIRKELIKAKIKENEIDIVREANHENGWMRFNYFWDNTHIFNHIR